MTTNFSEVFNSVLKETRNVPIMACVQMTFYRVNDYFALRRKPRQPQPRSLLNSRHTVFVPIAMGSECLTSSRG